MTRRRVQSGPRAWRAGRGFAVRGHPDRCRGGCLPIGEGRVPPSRRQSRRRRVPSVARRRESPRFRAGCPPGPVRRQRRGRGAENRGSPRDLQSCLEREGHRSGPGRRWPLDRQKSGPSAPGYPPRKDLGPRRQGLSSWIRCGPRGLRRKCRSGRAPGGTGAAR